MQEWGIILWFLLIGVLIFIAKVIKTWVPGLNKIVIPSALLGGFIGLIFSLIFTPLLTDGAQETFINVDEMGNIVYHALAIGFIALALKRDDSKIKKRIWSTGMLITSTYSLQALIGLILVFLFFSQNFVGSGMLVALGFGQGPGLAYSIGNVWDNMIGNTDRIFSVLGISYALLGFLFGGTIGVLLINMIARKKGLDKPKEFTEASNTAQVEVDTVKEISLLDGLTTQLVLISIIYGMVWLILYVLEMTIGSLAGGAVFGLIKGFNFIIGILIALLYKKVLRRFEKKGKNIRFMTNNYLLSNIASLSFNVMITGAVLTITLEFLASYGVQLIITSMIAGFITLFYLKYMTKRIYPNYSDEYFIGLFGMLTGVASTGLALLKGIDPELKTPVAEEMVLGSGTAITMAFPLFAILFIPSLTYTSPNALLWNLVALLGCLLYTTIFSIILLIRGKRGVNV